ncbi:polysaccharide pyruvyl transferase family protein [Salinicoccus sp. RF5]|uniref:polysaccharide pyruvyl transferase family protein n=1 Tax=Salinicoccus sp. RF5 TaxID=2748874 RepID=UPI001E2A5C99|nr:polysaccharide pyruvyl transferase family protein [Salinicoccus sp. RF5]MCC4722357.1 polysaccharide pyruvyl transferase family protein [Salinicoccus sp. RF5]
MNNVVILPSNNDLNRGDQALIWETIEVAKKAGYNSDYYMLAEKESLTKQSQGQGIKILEPILKHPNRKFKNKNNSKYTAGLIVKWGVVASFDLIRSILLLSKATSKIGTLFLSNKEKETLKLIQNAEVCFVKGGGFIHSSGKITDPYTIYYSLFHIALAQSFKKPVYVMPNSFGPFKGVGVKKMVKKVLKGCQLVTVRESISSKMLKQISVPHQISPDLGFLLEKESGEYSQIKNIRQKYQDYKLVGITARPYRFPTSKNPSKDYEAYIKSMAEFSIWLYKNKFLPVFVEHTLSEHTHENDGSAIEEITARLSEVKYEIISNDEYNSKDLKAIYSNLDYVVGTRFHSIIFSLSEGTPSLAITYGGNKGQGIMKDMNLSDYSIPIELVSFVELQKKFITLQENEEDINIEINHYIENVKNQRLKLINNVRKLNYKRNKNEFGETNE